MKTTSLKRLLAMALCLCMLLSLYVPSASADTVSYHEMSMSQILACEEDLTWVFTGDSITHNGGWTGGYNDYAAWFEQYLYAIGRGDDSLINTAWGGADIQDFLFYADTSDGQGAKADPGMGLEQFVTKYNPDVVFIKLGMNNRQMSDADFVNLYNKMLDGIYSEGAKNGKVPKIILLSPTPLSGEFGISSGEFGSDPTTFGYYDSVKRFSVSLSSIASQRGLMFVDLRQAFVDESAVLGDRFHYTFFSDPSDGLIHPNGAGQYFMFKTICKNLGLFDASMPIFRLSYDDITEAPLYNDETAVSYTGSYGSEATGSDNGEMDKTMPVLSQNSQSQLIASIDFTDKNGSFAGGAAYAGATRIDMTDASVMDDALTLAEAQALGTEFTVVLRARLDPSNNNNQPVLFVSSNGTKNWNNAISLGVQGKGDQMYYEIRSNSQELSNSSNTFAVDANKLASNGVWHTIAMVQGANDFRYYVDGVLVATKDIKINSGKTIGSVFANAANFVAHIGSYGENAGSYQLDGDLDFYQLYNGALSAEDVAYLAQNAGASFVDADEMNGTMPTIEGVNTVTAIEFTSQTGSFDGANTNLVDLTDSTVTADPLTFAEVQSLGKNFSVVLRGRLEQGGNANAGILLISDNGTAKWNDALTVGIPSQKNQGWLRLMNGGSHIVTPNGQYNYAGVTPAGDGQWHTLVITVSGTTYQYYLDGGLVDTRTVEVSAGIGDVITNEASFAARFGRYSDGDGSTYSLKGVLDYFQFYGQTLTAAQAAALSAGNAAVQMNATMPTLPNTEKVPNLLASVDFTSSNGKFVYNNTNIHASTLDLTAEAEGVDTLTVAEAQTLGKEYTVVFRAKLNCPAGRANQPILYLAGTSTGGFGAQTDKVLMGMPGTSNLYYQVYKDGKSVASLSGATTGFGSLCTDMNDGEWHTIAIVQSTAGLTYYVDGTAYSVTTNSGSAITINTNIGELFADTDEADFDAVIGRYGITDVNWKTQGDFDFWQMYDGALTSNQVSSLTVASEEQGDRTAQWSDIIKENNLWAVVGADQMSGYRGETPNFSLFRLLNNGIRGGGNNIPSCRDIRLLNLAKPGQTMSDVADHYDAIIGEHKDIYNVLMVLPELPEVHGAGYVHSAELVAAYKADVQKLVDKNTDKTVVLWSPLASADAAVNGYISDYAAAVREIANNDAAILFFDANKFMNERMSANSSLCVNWFDDSMNITPLCATDLAIAFYTHSAVGGSNVGELKSHNLRATSDKRTYKHGYMKDNLSYSVTVSGDSIYVDASVIAAAYPGITNLRVAVVPAVGIGSPVEPWILGSVGQNLTAPYSNPVITVYGDYNGLTYRFRDMQLSLSTANNLTEPYTETADLTALEVVGAPAIGFDPSRTTYTVELYQYQRQIRVMAEGGSNLTIQVNGKTVKAGDFSQYIAVEDSATVTVTVTGGTADKTYTLNLVRPDYPDIIITEVMTDGYGNYTKSGADNYELIEIYNASGRDLNLLDYSIGYIREYPYSNDIIEDGEIPYYFTGNDHNFFGNTYLGINQITKYSSYWEDLVDEEPEEVIFPADSAMVIWVKFSKSAGKDYGAALTYDTLISALEAHAGTHTLTVDVEENGTTVTKTVVPTLDQLVVAEIPYGAAQSNVTQNITTSATNFYMDNFSKQQEYNNRRGWLFVLDDSAVRDDYGALTEAGDDIIAAAKYVRPGDTNKLSSVMHYSTSRGLSIVKNPGYWDTNFTTGHTSDQQGYANLTSFGAVEYWQKPYDLGDAAPAVVENLTPAAVLSGEDAQIRLNITDNQDIRYLELYVDADSNGTYETSIKKDLTLITSATNGGAAKDITGYTQTVDLTGLTTAVKYYGFVLDGNNNKTELGSLLAPMTIEIAQPGQLKINAAVTDQEGNASEEKITVTVTLDKGDAAVGFAGNYVVYNAEGESVGAITNGTGTLTVGNGECLIVNGLPEGTGYTLTVTVPEGYEDVTNAEDLTGRIGTDGVTTVAARKSESAGLRGDLDGDGKVNDADVEYLLWHLLFPDIYPVDGDVDFNKDGKVNDMDVEYLLWHLLFPDIYPL